MNPLPPQAYTKETLLKAYHWIQSQAPSIREMALTPDILVSLYLKASRDGDHSLERPSIQNFKSELKSLAGLMGELDAPGPQPGAPQAAKPLPSAPQPPPQTLGVVSQPTPATGSKPMTAPEIPSEAKASMKMESLSTFNFVSSENSEKGSLALDERSMEAIRETRRDFNLSSDQEALRMLIQVGTTKAKSLIRS